MEESKVNTAPARPAPEERLVQVDEVARRLALSVDFVYKLAKTGKLPFARRIGRTVRFSESGLAAWIKKGGRA